MTTLFVHVYANQLNSLLVQYSIIKVRCNSKHCVALVHSTLALCLGHFEVVLLARHNWTGNKGGTLIESTSKYTKYVPRFHAFHLTDVKFENPSTSLILKEHAEMHATNSVSERSGGGGGGGGAKFSHHARANC